MKRRIFKLLPAISLGTLIVTIFLWSMCIFRHFPELMASIGRGNTTFDIGIDPGSFYIGFTRLTDPMIKSVPGTALIRTSDIYLPFDPDIRWHSIGGHGFVLGRMEAFFKDRPVIAMTERTMILPIWFTMLLQSLLPCLWLGGQIRSRLQPRPGHCASCGYDLRATPERCPECGVVVARASRPC